MFHRCAMNARLATTLLLLPLLLLVGLTTAVQDGATEVQDVQDAFRGAITDKATEAQFFDPVSWQLMREPMMCSDGEVYDNSTFAAASFRSAMDGQVVTALGPNKTLRRLIREILERVVDLPAGVDFYEGQIKDRKTLGEAEGTFYFRNGDVLQGNWTGPARLTKPNGDVLTGSFVEGVAHGPLHKKIIEQKHKAESSKEDSQRYIHDVHSGITSYVGGLCDGRPHGRGRAVYHTGNVYEGDFYHSRRHGRGRLLYANGDVYDGEWHYEWRNGHGRFEYTNGDVYEGGWRRDMRHGHGKLISPDGSVYEGEWHKNKRHGRGRMTFANGQSFERKYRKDKLLQPFGW